MYEINNYYEKTCQMVIEPKELLFYAIMYRKWNNVRKIIDENDFKWDEIKNCQFKEYEITIKDCFICNLDFLKSARNNRIYDDICRDLGEDFKNLEENIDTISYDDKRFYKKEKKSVIDIFWNGNQPVLDVTYIEKQTMPAKQVMKNKCSMVLDEVGTGKTVAGIYAIQRVIQERIDSDNDENPVSILIVCPYNKREDWYSDILRQLGRESNIVNQSDNGEIILNKSKRRDVPQIYISGNAGGYGDGSDYQLKRSMWTYGKEPWDLVIVDECHNCFENYGNIRARRALLLTATPIVVNSSEIRDFEQYKYQLTRMINCKYYQENIDPIEIQEYSDEDIFVCNFKEDLFDNITIDREIEFIECSRHEDRKKWYTKLNEEKDFFSAIFADQDDDLLAKKMRETFPEGIYEVEYNDKLEKLKSIIQGKDSYDKYSKDSFLIFCETQEAVNLIFENISGFASDKLMIGKLHSDAAEIVNKFTNKDIIMSILKNNIREGNRSILITTGKSGGTGLNLGEFDTVIHYELPFSSNELEQRFGRIERADDLIEINDYKGEKVITNRMLFLINKVNEGELDFETNRMLYYAINKIQITVKYMPIRNTILFHPEYRKRVTKKALEILKIIKDYLDDDNNKELLNDYFKYNREYEKIYNLIKKNDNIIKKEDLVSIVDNIINNTGRDKIDEENIINYKSFYDEYIENKKYESYIEPEKSIKVFIEFYVWLKMTMQLWGIKGNVKNDHEVEFESVADNEENDDKRIEKNKKSYEKLKDMQEHIFNKLKDDETRFDHISLELESLVDILEKPCTVGNYSGVFYIKDGEIINKHFN